MEEHMFLGLRKSEGVNKDEFFDDMEKRCMTSLMKRLLYKNETDCLKRQKKRLF